MHIKRPTWTSRTGKLLAWLLVVGTSAQCGSSAETWEWGRGELHGMQIWAMQPTGYDNKTLDQVMSGVRRDWVGDALLWIATDPRAPRDVGTRLCSRMMDHGIDANDSSWGVESYVYQVLNMQFPQSREGLCDLLKLGDPVVTVAALRRLVDIGQLSDEAIREARWVMNGAVEGRIHMGDGRGNFWSVISEKHVRRLGCAIGCLIGVPGDAIDGWIVHIGEPGRR